MKGRRSFIIGMLATGLVPQTTWAETGNPQFLSAAKRPDGTYVLCGLNSDMQIAFELPLPARGHAAAAHPKLAEAVVFARRPGNFAIVLDCASGMEKVRLAAPSARHFYGHGAFSQDGKQLFTTENDYENARGIVGVWDVSLGYRRVHEFSSGGVGPHDIKLMPDGKTLVIANGGIETHPETGRAKLNIPSMQSNLSYIDFDGMVLEKTELSRDHQKNSIRHLAVARNGAVAFAMQWQGDLTEDLPLLGVHRRDTAALAFAQNSSIRSMRGYLGSVATSRNGMAIATTSPRSGKLQVFRHTELVFESNLLDVCGVAPAGDGFVVTTGTGQINGPSEAVVSHTLAWDNHLVTI